MRVAWLGCLVACSAPAPTPTSPTSPSPPAPIGEIARPAAPSKYPAAPRGNVVETHHGVAVPDPYRWLETMDSPATRTFIADQNKLADEHLGKITPASTRGGRWPLIQKQQAFRSDPRFRREIA